MLFFSFGHAWNIARESYGLSDRTPLALAYAGVGLATLLLAWRGGRWVVPVTRAANVVAVLLVAFNVVRVGQFAIGSVVVLPAATASAAPMATAAWDVEALHRRYPDGPEQLRREGLDARAKVSEMVRIQEGPRSVKRLPRSLDEIGGLRAARWIRESTTGQYDRYGPASQREQQDRFIERHGLVDTGLVYKVAQSGTTVWRSPTMAEMLTEARAGAFDLLLAGYSDRWQRNLRRTLELLEDGLHPAGVALVMCDRRILSSDPHDWDELVAETAGAERYIRRLAERVVDGYSAKFEAHDDQAGNPPLGFRRGTDPPHTIEVDPATIGLVSRSSSGTPSVRSASSGCRRVGLRSGPDPLHPPQPPLQRLGSSPPRSGRAAPSGTLARRPAGFGRAVRPGRAGPPVQDSGWGTTEPGPG